MIAIINYQAGNLKSLCNALARQGWDAQVTSSADELLSADLVILPGVGAFGDAVEALMTAELYEPLRKRHFAGKPIMGICLGMQLFFEGSEEGVTAAENPIPGLRLMPGKIRRLQPNDKALKVPHMGWNQLVANSAAFDSLPTKITDANSLLAYNGMNAYFVHSYGLTEGQPEQISFTTDHGQTIPALVYQPLNALTNLGALLGFQFHPEKSGPKGEALLSDSIRILLNER